MRKPGLQRIEATLEQLQTQRVATADQAGDRAFSFKLSAATPSKRLGMTTEQVRSPSHQKAVLKFLTCLSLNCLALAATAMSQTLPWQWGCSKS
ncbi:hypothetical protein HC928_25525 [bacterium]|nr:hypothetical protein [bacterium]